MDISGRVRKKHARTCQQDGFRCLGCFRCFMLLFNTVLEAESLQHFLCRARHLFRRVPSCGKFAALLIEVDNERHL